MSQVPIVRSEVIEAAFGFYNEDEIRAMSVCHIVSPVVTDALGNAVPGGLYDARLGPTEPFINCVTCGMRYLTCSGHPGHIELDVPVYHPLLFPSMFQLLRAKCVYCNKFRMKSSQIRLYLVKLKLIEIDDEASLQLLENVISKHEDSDVIEDDQVNKELEMENLLILLEKKFDSSVRNRGHAISMHSKTVQRELIDQIYNEMLHTSKCENCGTHKVTFRKDGCTKIFQNALSKKFKSDGRAYKSALEQDGKTNDDLIDSDDDGSINSDEMDEGSDPKSKEKYLPPLELEAQIKAMWKEETNFLDYIWNRSGTAAKVIDGVSNGWKIFFMRSLLVPPSRFRPSSKDTEHPQNSNLVKILDANERLRRLNVEAMKNNDELTVSFADEAGAPTTDKMTTIISTWIELQNYVNCYMDSSKDPSILSGANKSLPGIRQLLERKEGLFRGNMMGKRVNHCCRSVISPDPYIGTNEVGIPVHFAKTLHYPTPVSNWNVKHLYNLVVNGPNKYPGANQIETGEGKIIKLDKLSKAEREGKAKMLLTSPGNKVYRHLVDGDVLLVNRQPTLHKPGIMAHKARVLQHVKEQTLRLNYANCNTYNADFDGDEMNCHFVQDEISRAEANYICNTDNQYIVPTSGNPLRGLIQDHVASAVKLTCKDTFLSRAEFQQLLYIAVSGLPGTEICSPLDSMKMPEPAIYKPKKLWTGKQVISSLISHMCRNVLPSLHLDGKARTPPTAFGAIENEHVIVFRHGELLSGVLDKAAIGNSSLGIVHTVYELYGPELAGRLLTAFGRLFTYFLQDAGHTCGIADLILTSSADEERKKLLIKVVNDADRGLTAFLDGAPVNSLADLVSAEANMQPLSKEDRLKVCQKSEAFIAADRVDGKVRMDGAMQSVINKSASNVIKACLPNGLAVPFIHNNFSMMVLTGAKGSAVNQSQISCFLGQQALEGQRVPMMVSSKSLPSFRANDMSARAGGFVRDRFLTGIKPQEFYFHCMAGREGLVDTAVKTSRSGYLQRCLVKHLEELRVHYDMTVRDSGSNIVQFLYGEDGLDPVHATLLGGKANQLQFIARNHQALSLKYSVNAELMETHGLDLTSAKRYHDVMHRAVETVNHMKNHGTFKEGFIVMCRRKIHSELPFSQGNILKGWHFAEIVKLRGKDTKTTYDVKYISDDHVEKKVSQEMTINTKKGYSVVTLIKCGLPDTAMSTLPLGTAVGACSEKIQSALVDYSNTNPDKVITKKETANTTTIKKLQLLVWTKYMRSLACPGEAVGCVAAQSVGEPSTQMTLNTFHLAGHGGANVTLGIPRLREIIMTASRTLKTPMMTIPLVAGVDSSRAKFYARQLSKLALGQLLSHSGGVEVTEVIELGRSGFSWFRHYRVKLKFENLKRIESSFGVNFDRIAETTKQMVISKVSTMVKTELRNATKSGGKGLSRDVMFFYSSVKPGDDYADDKAAAIDDGQTAGDDGDAEPVVRRNGKYKQSGLLESDSEVEEDDVDNEDADDVKKDKLLDSDSEKSDMDDDDENVKKNKTALKNAIDWGSSSDEEYVDAQEGQVDSSVGETLVADRNTPSGRKGSPGKHPVDLKLDAKRGSIEFQLSFPADQRRLLMVQLIEKACESTNVRSTLKISNVYDTSCTVNGDKHAAVQTEGVNFNAIWELSPAIVLHNEIRSNDIYELLLTYGVEAARQSIVDEIKGVFGVYGIDVNPRHLSLIADFMTRTGSYIPMNRSGMLNCPSPFVQMSFETTCSFLTKAAQDGLTDTLDSPTGQIVVGNAPKLGTGCFNLMVPMNA